MYNQEINDEIIAIYIDGDNVSSKDIDIILNEIKNYGRIIISRVYGDWSQNNMKCWLEASSIYGIIPIQCVRIASKNSSDIKLCVDIMKDLYSIDNITMFYIITTDSDYRHVVSEIKIKNKKVKCIGNSDANVSLMSICDTYTKIEVLRENDSIKEEINKDDSIKKEINKDDSIKKEINKDDSIKPILLQTEKEIKYLLLNNEKINISQIKDVLVRKYSFDLREWKYTKMSQFIIENFNNKFKIIKGSGICLSYLD